MGYATPSKAGPKRCSLSNAAMPATAGSKQTQFKPGQSGNPKGRKAGCRNHATILLDKVAETSAVDLLKTVIAKAEKGDMTAAGLILARIWPPRKGRPVRVPLPPIEALADLPAAVASLVAAVADGTLSPDEGQAIAAMLETQRRTIETIELARQVDELKQQVATMRGAMEDRR
jgi:Family of unknown function (DUF5681)